MSLLSILANTDAALGRWLNEAVREERIWRRVVATGAVCGSWTAAAMLSLTWLRAAQRRDVTTRRTAECGFLSVAVTYAAVAAIGSWVPRARPFADSEVTEGLVLHQPHRSFPSRHVASAMAMATTISESSPRLARMLVGIGVVLGVTRVAAGLHYPSDAIGGALLGILIGRASRAAGSRA